MSRLVIENGMGVATIGDYELNLTIDEVDDDGGVCFNIELLSIEDDWYARANFNPDTIHELIESLTLVANHFGLERPKTSLFAYNGEPGRC